MNVVLLGLILHVGARFWSPSNKVKSSPGMSAGAADDGRHGETNASAQDTAIAVIARLAEDARELRKQADMPRTPYGIAF